MAFLSELFIIPPFRETSMIQAIFFDLDQTLLDRTTSLDHFLNWQINFFQLIPQTEKARFIQRFLELDQNGAVWKDTVYKKLIDEFKIESIEYHDLLKSYISDFNKFSTGFPHIENTIRNLKQQGYLIGLISNGRTPFQEHNFYALGLSEYFSNILVSEAVGLRKPDPEIFNLACKQLDVFPEQCVFIGDNELADIQGAKNVGMKTIYFHPDPQINSKISDANLHDYQDIVMLLNQLSINTTPENTRQ
ncbi:HAD family hydrolase [Acinetobacter ursingii]|uniref:HAD family hydrolase n=1 Tax=Acinetobacter ursingii TaxID=108980 RepID=UPI001D186DB2|nr:HAD family hydrolase [Acinetobacter ursingii]